MAAFTITTEPYVVTMRSKAAEPPERKQEVVCEAIQLEVEIAPSLGGTELVKRVIEQEQGPVLSKADVIISGGRGIGGQEGFVRLSELATLMGGSWGE